MPPSSGYNTRDRRGRHRPADTPCRDCKAPMAWATASGGYRIALDVRRIDVERPPYLLLEEDGGDWRLAVRLADADLALEAQELGLDVRTSHFDTCPARLERMRPRERKDLE
jgi:hypothetical protein